MQTLLSAIKYMNITSGKPTSTNLYWAPFFYKDNAIFLFFQSQDKRQYYYSCEDSVKRKIVFKLPIVSPSPIPFYLSIIAQRLSLPSDRGPYEIQLVLQLRFTAQQTDWFNSSTTHNAHTFQHWSGRQQWYLIHWPCSTQKNYDLIHRKCFESMLFVYLALPFKLRLNEGQRQSYLCTSVVCC